MKLECAATVVNIRLEPRGTVIAEMRSGDLIDVSTGKALEEWVFGTVLTGVSTGKKGYVRRKWLIQYFDPAPTISPDDRTDAANIVAQRTVQYDAIHYHLGSKSKSWSELEINGYVDCSGWVYLLGAEILKTYKRTIDANKLLYTYSDEQITNCGAASKTIISGKYLGQQFFQPGVVVGIDFAEYAWDRNRPLDIDHIIMIGADANGLFVSQSSSSGGGVNRVPLQKWLNSQQSLIADGRVHLVDLLSIP